jgi:HSP20 family molecular chaperone IbpA
MPNETPPTPRSLARRTPAPARDFDQVFESLWNRATSDLGLLPFGGTGFAPWTDFGRLLRAAPTDVVDAGSAYQIKAEVPGLAKDQIDIRVTGNVVEISGENKTEKTDDSRGYLQRERVVNSFHRVFELPEAVVADKAKAQVVNGVLELELPKAKPTPQPAETKVKVQ